MCASTTRVELQQFDHYMLKIPGSERGCGLHIHETLGEKPRLSARVRKIIGSYRVFNHFMHEFRGSYSN